MIVSRQEQQKSPQPQEEQMSEQEFRQLVRMMREDQIKFHKSTKGSKNYQTYLVRSKEREKSVDIELGIATDPNQIRLF